MTQSKMKGKNRKNISRGSEGFHGRSDKMLSVGIDTHLEMHVVEVQDDKENVMWKGRAGNNRKGFDELLWKLKTIEESNNQKIVGIYINPTGNYHVPLSRFLEGNGYRVVAVDPRVSAAAREMDNKGRVKSDTVDAAALASLPWKKRKLLNAKTHERDTVSELTRQRESVQKNITRTVNFLRSDLAVIFPEYCTLFDDLTTKTSMKLLLKYTLPANIAGTSVRQLTEAIEKASRHQLGAEIATKLREAALSTVGVPDDRGIYLFKTRETVKLLEHLLSMLSEIDGKIKELCGNNEKMKLLDDVRGIDTVTAASIVSEIGPIEQFDSALRLKSYSGKAPDMKGSGGQAKGKRITRIRNTHLASTIYNASVSLVRSGNTEFKAVFDREMSKGKPVKMAFTTVGNRLVDSIYSMLKNNKPYCERIPRWKERDHHFAEAHSQAVADTHS